MVIDEIECDYGMPLLGERSDTHGPLSKHDLFLPRAS
jgi:hypothetical protein